VSAPRPAASLSVAAAQAESVSGDVEANVATAVSLVHEAADRGARVVVLPELFLTGYDPDAWCPQTSLRGSGDPRLAPLQAASRERGAIVVAGAALPGQAADYVGEATLPYHLALLAFGEGTAPLHVYSKQHLTDEEKVFFTAGRHGASIVVDGWPLGLGICFDGCFPEHAAAAAQDGAMAYLCPSGYYVGSEHRRDLYYAARALDNGIYVVFAGLTGRCGAKAFNGGSAIYDPEGRPVDRVGDASPALAFAALDPAEVARVQQMNPILRERLPGLGVRRTLTFQA
jgi:predicted amidohydrolase